MQDRRPIAILGSQRIPFARRNTAYTHASNVEMLTATFDAIARRYDLAGHRIGEVAAGAVLKHTRDFNLTREAVLSSKLAPQTPTFDVQQACATSLESAILIGGKIGLGEIEVGIAGGVDSTSDIPMALNEDYRQWWLALERAKTTMERARVLARFRPSMLRPAVPDVNERRTGLSMGEHCELMVKQWGITREAQDELALASHRNGVAAWEEGFYDDLVIPFEGLKRDNNLRSDTSMEKLAKLKPAYDKTSGHGTLTAGNSTPLTDGAAAVLLSSEAWAQAHGLRPLARLVDAETAAVEFAGPHAEGLLMAPAYAVPRLLKRNGLTLRDFDYFEIHEAFAGQVLCTLKAWEDPEFCRDRLGLTHALGSIDRSKLNVRGGSVGLGHPYAATGARILGAAAKQLFLHRAKTGKPGRTLVSICAAGGLGAVAILES